VEAFAQRIAYLQGDFMKPETYTALKAKLVSKFDKQNGQPRVLRGLFYFAIAPRL